MATRQKLTEFEKGQIQAFRAVGRSIRDIDTAIGRPNSTVGLYLQGKSKTQQPKKRGRKPKLTSRDHRRIISEAKVPGQSAAEIAATLRLPVK